MNYRRAIRFIVPGPTWQNPVIGMSLRLLDPIDYLVRISSGLSHLPRFSARVRSNGIAGQFGGRKFASYGKTLASLLQRYGSIDFDSIVLEIGCGCGRTAHALADIVNDGCYYGMDIEKVSLEACTKNSRLSKKNFHFDLMDVRNNIYNPKGRYEASKYVFPYKDEYFDCIFLISVFTHMLASDVSNYIKEISRLVKPNSICMFSTFLLDHGRETSELSFRYNNGESYYAYKNSPEGSVGYYLKFFIKEFSKYGMKLSNEPIFGSWRNNKALPSVSGFPQDILFFSK